MTVDEPATSEETRLAGLLLGTEWYSTKSEDICRITRAWIAEAEGCEVVKLRLEYRNSEQNGIAEVLNFRSQIAAGSFEPHSKDCNQVLEFTDEGVPA